MGDRYTLILRECAEAAKGHVSQFLGKAFSLKESTCATIAESMPIALLDDLSAEEAAVLQLVMAGLSHPGVSIQCTSEPGDDLPKIDWPKRPPVFKRELSEWVADARIAVPLPGGNSALVLDLLIALLAKSGTPGSGTGTVNYNPQEAPVSEVGAVTGNRPAVGTAAREFKGSRLPEITPFSNVALSSSPTPSPNTRKATAAPADGGGDPMSRLNELFPDDGDAAFVPDKNDITSILNKLLPDEEGGGGANATSDANNSGSSARLNILPPTSGYSLFLAKIGDEGRREKAVPLIAELAKITKEEAEALSKKVIIPVLKGSTKDEAEAAKQRFAKIGILARIKGAGEH